MHCVSSSFPDGVTANANQAAAVDTNEGENTLLVEGSAKLSIQNFEVGARAAPIYPYRTLRWVHGQRQFIHTEL